jgi:cytochrome c heme-lyase
VLLLLLLLLCPAMNEMTWRKVQDWEQLHCQECQYPTLLKFQGKPHDLR